VSFDQIDKHNEKFERFYNTINIVPAGPERDAFWAALKKELPNSFRFTGSKGHALSVRDNLVNRFFPVIREIQHDGKPVELPKQMPWYPDGLAYSMATPKNVVRKYEPFKEFQKFLVSETGVGNISRQEEVSMIPPMLLDVQPHHTVLDLCAAPGSKSAQLVELIHAGEEDRVARGIKVAKKEIDSSSDDAGEDYGRTTGMLIANDVDYRRAQMLVHQVKRLNSPNLIVTNHDATMFPSIALPPGTTSNGQKQGKYLKFDRVLADVPCSGDGTCRKNPNIWKDWQPQNGLGLYITQVRILTRSLQMLKVGGRAVYSTCSMNPVENEAVVASAIERCGGTSKVKLVDCSDRLPGLLRNPGLTDWSVMNKKGDIFESWPEAEQFEGEGSRLVPGMFPPGPEEGIPLENCWRVYPQQQDTGGFFICALEKLGEIHAKPEAESKSANRSWAFTAPEAPHTAFTELLDDVANGTSLEPKHVASGPSDGATAADRQNGTEDITAGAGVKREAPDDGGDSQSAKKPRLGEDVPDRIGTRPVPPSIALSLEASGVDPGSNVADGSVEGQVSNEVKEGAASAPFQQSVQAVAVQKRRKDEDGNVESFKYLASDHPELLSIYKFYELHDGFPRDRFLVRNPAGDPVKGIYYTSQLVKDILLANENRGMKFVHAGVKMFMKQDAQGQDICRWRIQTEGLPIIEGWVGEKRVVHLRKKSTLRKLLVEMFPKVSLDHAEDGTESGGWMDLGEIGDQVKDVSMGCCVLRVEASPDAGEDEFKEAITLPLWRSKASLNLMLPKEDRRAMLLRIYNEDVELINHSDPKHGIKGSRSAENDAQELQEKIANDDSEETGGVTAGAAPTELDGMAAEQDAIAATDKVEQARLEVLENEDRKIAEAMPERDGDAVGDHYNTTV
jgi:multisite-specific tRNA:(cytosine-C5)-methyltransferase